jgi:hypothetical protein
MKRLLSTLAATGAIALTATGSADASTHRYPPAGHHCGYVSFAPATDWGTYDITANIGCRTARRLSRRVTLYGAPVGWTCRHRAHSVGMMHTDFACRAGDRRVSWAASWSACLPR